MQARQMIDDLCRRMKPGQSHVVTRRIFEEAYVCGFPTIYYTPEQAFLSSKIGSAWGGWRVCYNPSYDAYIISRHEEGVKRVYVDPDRAHLFDRMPDGSLKYREKGGE